MFTPFVTFVASVLIWILFIGLGVLWLIDGRIKKEQVVHALIAVFIAWLTTFLIKDFFPRNRPFVNDNMRPITLTIPKDPSFPSTHTAVAFALATTIYLHDKKVGRIFLVEALLVAVARVLADVHYPIDVTVGAFLGVFIAWSLSKIHVFNRS